MKVTHSGTSSYISGKPSEDANMLAWIVEVIKIDPNYSCFNSDKDETEITYTVTNDYIGCVQKVRQEDFQQAKKNIGKTLEVVQDVVIVEAESDCEYIVSVYSSKQRNSLVNTFTADTNLKQASKLCREYVKSQGLLNSWGSVKYRGKIRYHCTLLRSGISGKYEGCSEGTRILFV